MVLSRPDVMTDVLVEHLEELGFLLELRQGMLESDEDTLADLAALDGRAAAHLDGLLVGQGRSADLAFPLLGDPDLSAARAGAQVLLALGEPELQAAVVELLPELPSENQDAVRLALRHGPIAGAEGRLRGLAREGAPISRAVALDVLAFWNRLPRAEAGALFGDPDPLVRRIALTAAARARLGLTGGVLESALADEEPAVRRTALQAAARSTMPGAAAICRATARTAMVPEAVAFLGVVGGEEDVPFLLRCLETPFGARPALAALGALGRPSVVPHLLAAMRRKEFCRPAGAAFVRVTGAEIEGARPSPPPGATEDEIDDFDDRPLPDPDRATAFWGEHGPAYDPDRVWQCGRDVSTDPFGPDYDHLTLAARRDVFLRVRATDPNAAPTPDPELP